MNIMKLNVSISEEVGEAIENLVKERIKTEDGSVLRTWNSKSSLVDSLLKIGLIHYHKSRKKDSDGGLL